VGPIMLQMNPNHTLLSCFFKIHFNITLSRTLRFPTTLHLGFTTDTLVAFSSLPCMPHITDHLVLWNLVTVIIFLMRKNLMGMSINHFFPKSYYISLPSVEIFSSASCPQSSCFSPIENNKQKYSSACILRLHENGKTENDWTATNISET
jgi:hypothetical protein